MPDATGSRENGNAASPLHFTAHHRKSAVRSPTPIPPKTPQAASPCSWGGCASNPSQWRWPAGSAAPARGAGVLFSVRHPGARGKEGAVPCDAALPPQGQGALPVCGVDAVCPCGAKALQSGAPDFGWFAGESCLRSGLPIRNGWQARWEDGSMPSYAP